LAPRIYTPASIPTIAELGEATEVSESEPCPACNRQPPPRFTFVEFIFDVWDGEDLVTAMDVWAASERLRNASEQSGLTGAQFDDMRVTKAEYFEPGGDAYAPDLPRFHRVDIGGRAQGPETWWISEVCEQCGLRAWERTSAGTRAEIALAFGEPAPPRQVYRGSWSGDDFFRLDDPGPPLVTERVKDVFERLPVKEVSFQPAEWVDE
jgi:hypothetical protein